MKAWLNKFNFESKENQQKNSNKIEIFDKILKIENFSKIFEFYQNFGN